jgi:hypothetical protein
VLRLPLMNRLYFGDNLKWLSDRKEFADASVDLVYLDPPFNSNADYNVLFREPSGQANQAQFHAFTDTWSWADAADASRHTSMLWHDRDYPRIQILTVEGFAERHRARRCPAADQSIRNGRTRSDAGKANGDAVAVNVSAVRSHSIRKRTQDN